MISLKPTQTLVKPYEWVWHLDPAFDRERKIDPDKPRPSPTPFELAYKAYLDHGDLATHLGEFVRDGERPSVFTLRHLTGETRQWVIDNAFDHDMTLTRVGAYLAVALALVEISDLVIEGEPFKVRRTVIREQARVAEEQMDMLARVESGALVFHLGDRIMGQTLVPDPLSRG